MEIRIGNLKEMVIVNIVMYFLSYFLYTKGFFRSGRNCLVSGAGGAGNRRAGNLLSLCEHPYAKLEIQFKLL